MATFENWGDYFWPGQIDDCRINKLGIHDADKLELGPARQPGVSSPHQTGLAKPGSVPAQTISVSSPLAHPDIPTRDQGPTKRQAVRTHPIPAPLHRRRLFHVASVDRPAHVLRSRLAYLSCSASFARSMPADPPVLCTSGAAEGASGAPGPVTPSNAIRRTEPR